MTIRLNEADRARVRHHLGYLNVEPVVSITLGLPAVAQASFLVETAMDRLIPSAVQLVQRTLDVLDHIECQMVDSLKRLKVQQLGEMKLRNNNTEPTESDLLEQNYRRWAERLADDLGVPLNAYSERFRTQNTASVNLRVVSGT